MVRLDAAELTIRELNTRLKELAAAGTEATGKPARLRMNVGATQSIWVFISRPAIVSG